MLYIGDVSKGLKKFFIFPKFTIYDIVLYYEGTGESSYTFVQIIQWKTMDGFQTSSNKQKKNISGDLVIYILKLKHIVDRSIPSIPQVVHGTSYVIKIKQTHFNDIKME